jgi:hypothetical protein
MRIAVVLAVVLTIAGAAYALNRGIFVGSRVYQAPGSTGTTYWYRDCSYLFPSGVVARRVGGWDIQGDADNEACRLFLLD